MYNQPSKTDIIRELFTQCYFLTHKSYWNYSLCSNSVFFLCISVFALLGLMILAFLTQTSYFVECHAIDFLMCLHDWWYAFWLSVTAEVMLFHFSVWHQEVHDVGMLALIRSWCLKFFLSRASPFFFLIMLYLGNLWGNSLKILFLTKLSPPTSNIHWWVLHR